MDKHDATDAAVVLQALTAVAFRKKMPEIDPEDVKVTEDKILFNARKTLEHLGIGIDEYKRRLIDAFCIYSFKPEAKKDERTESSKAIH